MRATVKIEKSFDDEVSEFTKKSLEEGDLREFFDDEGTYLERLVKMMEKRGKKGDAFEVTYTVTVTK